MQNMEHLLIELAKGLVENKDSVSVTIDDPNEEGIVVFHLDVADDDKGRVIGKKVRIAKAIRTVMRAGANRLGYKVSVDIV